VEFTALFIWLSLCLVLGGLIHSVITGALSHRFVRLLAAPGMIIRKFTMTLMALACGATITRVKLYDLSTRDIDFHADGMPSIAKVLAPLAPLFGCAVAMTILNAAFGDPLNLNYTPPALESLDTGGLRGFLLGTWALLAGVIRQGLRADWQSLKLYVLFALIFSLALGAAGPMDRLKEAVLGSGLLAVTLALLSSIAIRRAGVVAATPGWFNGVRTFVVDSAGVAFIMMVYGLLTALVVGLIVRVYELASRSGTGGHGRTASLPADRDQRRAA